jgi:putative NIF3 family GTP cyclohydrolase 1 type 2
MRASDLFEEIEKKIPLDAALRGDTIGYFGGPDPKDLDVKKVLVLMDLIIPKDAAIVNYEEYDLLILHHPPVNKPEKPVYVIHSNWDIIQGGASDALADLLNINTYDVLDDNTGIGRIGKISKEPFTLDIFIREIMINLKLQDIRIVNYNRLHRIENICLVSGFGLQPDLISKAYDKSVDLIVSGDLTHKGAILGKSLGIILADATHYATEFPGLCRLGELIASMGPDVEVRNTGLPWMGCLAKTGIRRG